MKSVMFYCQHSLGMGHLVRSTALVRALSADFHVTFVTGGKLPDSMPFPAGVEVISLPALQMDSEFFSLQVCNSFDDLDDVKSRRQRQLLSIFDRIRPDALMTELFPFGRKAFSFELVPLLKRARKRKNETLVVCSLRDVLVNRKDQVDFEDRVCRTMNDYYDLLLVHGDPRFQRLDETFSRLADLRCEIEYTGFVARVREMASHGPATKRKGPLIVASVGAGRCEYAHNLLSSFLRTTPILTRRMEFEALVFTGPFVPEGIYRGLTELAANQPNVTLQRFTPDLPGYLREAQLSVSMGGYNTTMDIVSAGVRSLVYPASPNGDTEQTFRGRKMQELGVLQLLDSNALVPEVLADRIVAALQESPSGACLDLDGAGHSRELLLRALQRRSALQRASA